MNEQRRRSWQRYFLAVRAGQREAGWVTVEVSRGLFILVHPDKDCVHSACPLFGQTHRHTPSDEDREIAYENVTRWLEFEYAVECERVEVAQLEAMFELSDPRTSFTVTDLTDDDEQEWFDRRWRRR